MADNQNGLPKYEIAAEERNYHRQIPPSNGNNYSPSPCTCQCQVSYQPPNFPQNPQFPSPNFPQNPQFPPPNFTQNPHIQPQHQLIEAEEERDCVVSEIPVMPMWCAITLLVVNCLIPGLGTIMAAFTVGCCNTKHNSCGKIVKLFFVNFYVGLLQMITVPLLLFGYVWAVFWGIQFVKLAGKRNSQQNTMYGDNPGYGT